MKNETKRIHALLQNTYNGNAWHGSPVVATLQGITAAQAQQRVMPDYHTIWELVLHVTSWRNFAWNKLKGNPAFDIQTPEQDWPIVEATTETAWQSCLQALELSQQNLLHAIWETEDEKLEEIVPGRNYSFYVLLHGIIQHDLYHTGQMAILRKSLS